MGGGALRRAGREQGPGGKEGREQVKGSRDTQNKKVVKVGKSESHLVTGADWLQMVK